MWRAWLSVLAAAALATGAPPASTTTGAQPGNAVPPGAATGGVLTGLAAVQHGDEVCTVTDSRLDELSGMVRQPKGFVVVDDGSDLASHWRIFYLDDKCRVTRTVAYPSRPRDTEDLALARDGTLWVADIGDNNDSRSTVALWRLANGARTPVLYRLRYPDRAHDAEALVLTGDGTPMIVTKDPGEAVLYQPASALRAGDTVPLRRVGAFDLPLSGTSNPFSFAGHMVVTGGANSPDGTRVVLRTYSDAFEFQVTGGDVVRAITTGTPRVVPLPDEPQGESITYDHDGVSLLTVSEKPGAADPEILRYPRTAPSPPAQTAQGGSAAGRTPGRVAATGQTVADQRPLPGMMTAGVIGVLVLAGLSVAVVLAARFRRR